MKGMSEPEPDFAANRVLVEEAHSLRHAANILLADPRAYDARKLSSLIDAMRNCADRCRQADHIATANDLMELAAGLAKRSKSPATQI
jgi:hypothetical protein